MTPASVPPTLLRMSCDPPLVLTAPPLIVPPSSVQDPLAASRFSPPPNVPVRFTVPPVRTKLPSVARVKLPARFIVEFVATIVPALLQLPLRRQRRAADQNGLAGVVDQIDAGDRSAVDGLNRTFVDDRAVGSQLNCPAGDIGADAPLQNDRVARGARLLPERAGLSANRDIRPDRECLRARCLPNH